MSKSETKLSTANDPGKSHTTGYNHSQEKKYESLHLTKFTEKYGTKWRWALFIHILSLIKDIDINYIDKDRLSLLIEVPVDYYEDSIEEFFNELYNMVSKQCMVNIRMTPLTGSVHGQKKYEIGIL
ncbi:MAG: hypothetical protein ACTSP4_14705 [Candidatus Hodarchaeales archaeon]